MAIGAILLEVRVIGRQRAVGNQMVLPKENVEGKDCQKGERANPADQDHAPARNRKNIIFGDRQLEAAESAFFSPVICLFGHVFFLDKSCVSAKQGNYRLSDYRLNKKLCNYSAPNPG
jgi:hypothetical protein